MKQAWHLWLVAVLAGCAGSPVEADRVDIDTLALRGELALEAERPDEAAAHFLEAAGLAEEPALAERATAIAYEAGLQDTGLAAAERWLELEPEDPRAHWFAGIFETRFGRVDSATAHFDDFVAAARDRGGDSAGLPLVVEALIAEPDPAPAVEVMRALVDRYPNSPDGRYGLARLGLRAGDFELALDNARRATELRPDWVEAELLYARTLLVAGRTDESLELARGLAERSNELEVNLQLAELLLSAGRADEARTRLTAILDENPGLPEATRALAFLAMSDNDLPEARRLFEDLRHHLQYRDEAFYYLGRIAETEEQPLQATRAYARVTDGAHAVEAQLRTARIMTSRLGNADSALRHLQEFGDENPRFRSDMLVARAQLLVQTDRPDDAMELFDEALARNPDDESLQNAQAELYVLRANDASGRGNYAEAETLLTEGIRRYPDHVSVRYSFALLLQEQGEMSQSAEVLEGLVGDHPDNPVLLNALGYLLTDQFDRHEEARDYIQRALAMQPDSAAIIDSMGWVLYHLGEYESAFDYLQRAYRLEQDPEIAAHLVDVQWARGAREEALALLETALATNPNSLHLNDVARRLRQ